MTMQEQGMTESVALAVELAENSAQNLHSHNMSQIQHLQPQSPLGSVHQD